MRVFQIECRLVTAEFEIPRFNCDACLLVFQLIDCSVIIARFYHVNLHHSIQVNLKQLDCTNHFDGLYSITSFIKTKSTDECHKLFSSIYQASYTQIRVSLKQIKLRFYVEKNVVGFVYQSETLSFSEVFSEILFHSHSDQRLKSVRIKII